MTDDYSLLLKQFGPTEEDKAAAQKMAFMRAGLGILAANAPSPTPKSTLGILAQGGAAGLDGYANDLKQRTDERKSNSLLAMQAAKIKREMGAAEALKNFTATPTPTAGQLALTAGAAQGDIGPTHTNLKRLDGIQATPGAVPVPNFGALIAAGVSGETVKALMEDWKLRNPELDFTGGIPKNRRTGQPVSGAPMLPQTNQQGFSTTPRFNHQTGQFEIGITPGATDAYTTQQDISEAARARRDPFMGVVDASGRPVPMTREGFSQRFGGASAPGAAPGAVPAPTGMGPTPAESRATVTAAEGDAKRVLDLEAKIPSLLSVQRRLGRMEGLTQDDATYAAAGSELKNALGSIGQAFGLKVNEKKTANTEEYLAHVAELLKDRLASKDFGSGSGVSNLDIIAARAPLPELAKTSAGRMQIISALKADTERNLKDAQAARDYFDTNRGLRGFRFPSELDAERAAKEDRVRDLGKGGSPSQIPAGVKVKRVR